MWKVISASVRGSGHEKSEQPCQDAHYWHVLDNDILVAAVADGAGSASRADLGAEVAVKTAVEYASKHDNLVDLISNADRWTNFSEEIYQATREAVETEAINQQVSSREMASTLLLLLATPNYTATMQIGDGAIVTKDSQDRMFTTIKPIRSEYINATTFLISDNADQMMQQAYLQDVHQIAMFSDGLEMLALEMPQGEPFRPFFLKIFDFATLVTDKAHGEQQLVDFLQSPRLRKRTADDVTLLLATYIT